MVVSKTVGTQRNQTVSKISDLVKKGGLKMFETPWFFQKNHVATLGLSLPSRSAAGSSPPGRRRYLRGRGVKTGDF